MAPRALFAAAERVLGAAPSKHSSAGERAAEEGLSQRGVDESEQVGAGAKPAAYAGQSGVLFWTKPHVTAVFPAMRDVYLYICATKNPKY